MTAVERDSFDPEPMRGAAPVMWAVPAATTAPSELTRPRHAKRVMDIGLVLLATPVVVPLMLVIAIVVRLTSPGPILFRQERLGRGGDRFVMLKVRTMYVDATERLRADGALSTQYLRNDYKLPLDEDPRITPTGRFLRHTSLDELPQLWNVLRGQMSLVGPRPVVPGELQEYGDLAAAYVQVRPGITGRWQTDGRNHIRYPERAQIDADYVEEWTLWGDVVILLKTIPCVIRRRGSH